MASFVSHATIHKIMSVNLFAAIRTFVFMTWFMYKGAVGRMARLQCNFILLLKRILEVHKVKS